MKEKYIAKKDLFWTAKRIHMKNARPDISVINKYSAQH